MAKAGITLGQAKPGDVCSKAMESGQGNYLANLILYPGGTPRGWGAGGGGTLGSYLATT